MLNIFCGNKQHWCLLPYLIYLSFTHTTHGHKPVQVPQRSSADMLAKHLPRKSNPITGAATTKEKGQGKDGAKWVEENYELGLGSGGCRGVRNEQKGHWRKEEGTTQESGEIFGTILTGLWWDDQWNNELPTQENRHHINTALFIQCVCHRAHEKGTYSFHSWTIPFYQNATGFKLLNNCTHSKHLYIWQSYLNQWIYSWKYERQWMQVNAEGQ